LTTTNGDVPTVKRFKQTVTTEIKRHIVTKVAILSRTQGTYLQLKFLNEDQCSAVVDRFKLKAKEVESDLEGNDELMMRVIIVKMKQLMIMVLQ